MKELATIQPQPPAIAEPSIAAMLSTALANGITKDNADGLGKMMELYERMEDRRAEREFAAAFVDLQGQLPVIVASSEIPNRGKYERYEDVMRVVAPLLSRNNFSVSFAMEAKDSRIFQTCILTHAGGHTRRNSFGCRLGGRSDSETQADCKAATTAKRNALLNALNIVIRQDCLQDEDAAHNDGALITDEEAHGLRGRVLACGADEAAFLGFAGAAHFEAIGVNRLPDLEAMLVKKEIKSGLRNADGEYKF